MEGSAQSRRAMTSPRNMHLEKRYLEETFDLPSESACSFDSEPLQTLSPASGKETQVPPGQAKGRDIGDGTTNCLASTAAASDCSPVRMSSTLDTLDIEKSRKEQPAADVRQAALNFSTALQSAPARQFPALWTLPQEKPEAGFGVKAECLVQEQAAFVRKVEQELKRFGQTLDQHSCFQQALKKQLEDQGRVWLKEAQNLSHDVQQLRAQLAQTMEAALWSGKEVAAVRKEIASLGEREDRPRQSASVQPLPPALAERLAVVEEQVEMCNKHVAESNDFFAKAISQVSETVAQVTENLSDMKRWQVLHGTGPGRPPVTTPQIPQWLAESLELRKPATSPSPDEEQLLSAPADSIAATAASKTKAPTSRPPELVTDGKRAANVARLGGRRIPVR